MLKIATPLGPMVAFADDFGLYFLDFVESKNSQKKKLDSSLPSKNENPHLLSIKQELKEYFRGNLKTFQTPLHYRGTPFQNRVWHALERIPFGSTLSYLDIAKEIENPQGCRAVARANATNQIAIVIPCHRVINTGGAIGGYGGGIFRKEWLLEHEKANILLPTENYPNGSI